MTGRAARIALIFLTALAACTGRSDGSGSIRLARVFGDGMVMQRDAAIPVWGSAPANTAIVATLGDARQTVTADSSGAWRVTFPAMVAGGPHRMSVSGGGGRVDVANILIGDVWVASGQSNMEWPVDRSDSAAAVIASANDTSIRELSVSHSFSETPQAEIERGSWAVADPRTVGKFSAVAYFFARELRKSVDVPIGIIHTSWGGANIQTWMSRQALELSDSAWNAIVAAERARTDSSREAIRKKVGALPTLDSGLVDGKALWAAPELVDDSWDTIPTPGIWEAAGYPDMDGVAWYRTSFTLGATEIQQPVRLSLGTVDDSDIAWVNGVEVGRTVNAYAARRLYTIPATALRAGRNVVAVRVEDLGGGGGINGDSASVWVEVGGVRRSLAGAWRFKVGRVSFLPDGQRINKVPSFLYNSMVHPLLDVPIKGVIWYQGESNANNMEQATAYRRLFSNLISSWRREWRGTTGDFPFLWVQLPNFGKVDSTPPANASWATVRESQAAALALPNTGQVVAIDLGGASELHPPNKQPVGARLALKAREVAYGQQVSSSGPRYRSHTVTGARITIELDDAGSGIVSRGDTAITGFAIAGRDRRFVWARARVDGDRLVVWSDQVPSPVAVRYLWTNSPRMPALYNQQGLPLEPFRTDSW